ncbi:probable serine/threonine-protein kinase drkB [Lingula anatina]|uniref:Probable serine/threonine-protein kinase drkB n=1 Tax=Lingula anatina TaxID=7574 RepID=A0A1S3JN74_LINAN|nr:probable serine/threonine-protein kinase drkB [Lingula anatina]|eukprot:XP_013411823.1 probable serine/threonine-protein kinase drkB [Lingula anatina]
MAPEILRKEKYGAPADMYTVGVMIWEMWYGKRIYNLPCFESFENISDILELDWASLITLEGFTPPPPIWCKNLEKLLSPTPSERPTASKMEKFLEEETRKRFHYK